MTKNNSQLSVAEKIALAKKDLNRASKAEPYYNQKLELLEIRFMDQTTMSTEKGTIKLEPTRWFCRLDDEEIIIETYTAACKSFAEKLIEVFEGETRFDFDTPVTIEFTVRSPRRTRKTVYYHLR
jgi:hypothetical protein